MASWLRLWHDMPTDPKWRVIARRSGQSIGNVIAVYSLMLVCASAADERGTIENWSDEDAAAALDMDPEDVTAIRSAMQSKVLDGETLSGWQKRQPEREDYSTPRVKRYREKHASHETHCNASETHGNNTEKNRTEKRREETETAAPPAAESVLPITDQILLPIFNKIAIALGQPDLPPIPERLAALRMAAKNVHIGGYDNIVKAARNLARSNETESHKTYDWLLSEWPKDRDRRITQFLTQKNGADSPPRKYTPVPDDWESTNAKPSIASQ